MRKTKIICTIGPASTDEQILTDMCRAGMNVARLNFSHGNHEEQLKKVELIKKVREKLNLPIAIMLDTKGPEYRIKTFQNGMITLNEGDSFTFTTEDIIGDQTRVSVNYEGLSNDLQINDRILLNNGLMSFRVESIEGTEIHCRVLVGGELSNRKSMSFPNKVLKQTYLSEQDKKDLLLGIENHVDFIAASFVSCKQDILDLKAFLSAHGGGSIDIIAKIENRAGVDNIEDICGVCEGIMVARGDLGVEVPFTELPAIQKQLITTCRLLGTRVITATEMLESMIQNPRPTRAEISDVANAVYDGTSAIMLSGETAAGKYPIEAVTMMGEIAEQTERYLKFEDYRDGKALEGKLNVSAAVGSAAVSMVEHIKAACIVTPTMSGQTARLISNLRPSVPIYGVTPYEWARRKMQLYWGVRPVTGYEEDSTENIISHAMYMVRREELVERGDMVIFTAGDPATNEVTGEGYMTNMLHIIQAK